MTTAPGPRVLGASVRVRLVRVGVSASLFLLLIGYLAGAPIDTRAAATFLAVCTVLSVLAAWWHRSAMPATSESTSNGDGVQHAVMAMRARVREAAARTSSDGADFENQPIEYLTGFSHQLRTPLNSILGFCDVLLGEIDGPINGEQREDLGIVRGSGLRLRMLVDSALDFSLAVQGALTLARSPQSADRLIEQVVFDVQQFRGGRGDVKLELGADLGTLDVEPVSMGRALVAVADHVQAYGRGGHIVVKASVTDEAVWFQFAPTDAAAPLPATNTRDLLAVLRAEDPTTVRQWPVVIAAHIVALHDGTLTVDEHEVKVRIPKGTPKP